MRRAAGLLLPMLAACTGPMLRCPPRLEEARPAPLPVAFSGTGEAATCERWWTALQDPVLDRLVEQALGRNVGLRAARERVVEAAALARRAGAPLAPQLDATASVGGVTSRREVNDVALRETAEALALGAAASYELDLWGRLRATQREARWEACASAADLAAARITLSARVASTWYGYVEETRIERLLEEQVETNQKLLSLIRSRFERGKVGAADVLRQQQLVERTRGDLSLTASRRALRAHELATLGGRPATASPPPPPPDLIELGPLPATGVPATTLQRRPDVQAAWRRVHAADCHLAASIADCYPRVDLSASAVLGGAGFELLLIDRIAQLAADLVAPILDGGERRAQVRADAAHRRQRLFEFQDAVLLALQEVEDALVQERRQREHLQSLERQHTLAVQVVDTLLGRYGQGAAAYLDVLAAVQSEQSLTLSLVSARRLLIAHRIALCRAIAGPWRPL